MHTHACEHDEHEMMILARLLVVTSMMIELMEKKVK